MCDYGQQLKINHDGHKKKTLTDDASWGQEREVILERFENKSFGISIVGGKVTATVDFIDCVCGCIAVQGKKLIPAYFLHQYLFALIIIKSTDALYVVSLHLRRVSFPGPNNRAARTNLFESF